MRNEIQIDREFMNLTVPISDDEQVRLERSLMREGCLEPVTTWRGVILDGHKRYKFCSFEEIEFEMREMEFASREEAVIWVCKARVAGLTVHQPMYRYLVGKWYNCQKILNKERRRQAGKQGQNPDYEKSKRNSQWDTSSRLAEEIGIARSTIEDNGKYATAMDRIADTEPALFEAILRREVFFKHSDIIEMSKMDEKQLGEIRRKKLGRKDIKMRKRSTKDTWLNTETGDEHMEEEIPIVTGIKEMPAFDPDMEINGLGYTIPSWINRIARTEKNTDMEKATDEAKQHLTDMLLRLAEQIDHTLEVLK